MKKRLTCFALVIALLSTVTVLAVSVYAENDVTVPSSGHMGESHPLPSEVTVDGKKVPVTARVITPSGRSYSATRLDITEIGRYTVELVDGNGQVVSTQYCTAIRRSTDMISTNNYASVQGLADYQYYSSDKGLSGVKVNVSAGAEITVEREIDMTNRTKNDILSSVVIEPAQKGSRDFGRMILTFTDVDDPSVYFTVVTTTGNQDTKGNGGRAYIRAGGNGQLAGGYEQNATGFTWNTTDIYGARAPFSFQADVLNDLTSNFDFACKLCYDSDENALYLANGEIDLYGEPYLVVDFDDVSIFGTNVWGGFPSGRAKLTITFDFFVNKTGSVIINQVDGIDLSSEQLADTEAPQITVDLGGERYAPNSYIGASYKIFDAIGSDFYDLETPVTARVYYKSGDARLDVAVKDGCFVTDRVGEYEIEYRSQDRSGNLATEVVSLFCVSNPNQIVIDLDAESIEADVFTKVTLKDASEIRCTGGNGNLTKTLKVYSPSSEIIDLVENSFVPDTIGMYKAEYTATDFFGNAETKTVEITVNAVDKPVFIGQISLPELFIKGFTYEFPAVEAILCEDGNVKAANVRYFVGDSEVVNGNFTVDGNDETVKVECRAYYGNEQYVSLEKTIPVVDGNGGKDQHNYFYNADNTVTTALLKDSVALDAMSDGEIFFANKLNNSLLDASFSFQNGSIGFSSASIKLSSADDKTKTVTFTIGFSSLGLTISAKGLSATTFATKNDTQNTFFAIDFDGTTNRISDIAGNVLYELAYYDDGTEFNGFSGGIYLSVGFTSVKMQSRLCVTAINNQAFGYKYDDSPVGDKVAPQIVIDGVYSRRLMLGDTLTLYTATAFDVLNQVQDLTLTVYDPDNNQILSKVEPNKLYTVTLDKVGRYRIVYSATDTVGNSKGAAAGTTINVVDNVTPELSVKLDFDELYRVGSTIELPKFTVTDNTENVYCDIYLQLPSNETRLLAHYQNGVTISYLSASDSNYPSSFKAGESAFVLEEAGKYVISYVAYDDSFNYVRYTAEFTAVE